MKCIQLLTILLLIINLQVKAGDKWHDFSEKQIITIDMIRDAGLTRVADILLLANDWIVNTIDGFTWQASANGLSSFQRQTWLLMIDGQRMDINIFDITNLNMLPISINQIDYVEIISIPQIIEGEFTDKGLIHIHTVRPEAGLSYHGRLTYGNETGDPGPYRYTEFKSKNVDRIGADRSNEVSFAGKKQYIGASQTDQVYYPTDAAIYNRNQIISGKDYPRINMSSYSFKAGINALKGEHELFAGYTFVEDFLFFKPYGREIPVKSYFTHAGVNGFFMINDKTDIHYRCKYSTNRLKKRANIFDLDFDRELENVYANLEVDRRGSFYQSKIGIRFDRSYAHTKYQLDKDAYSSAAIYGQLNYSLTDNLHQSFSAFLRLDNDKIAVKGQATNSWKINSKQKLISILSFSQRNFEEDNSYWRWAENGYNFLEANSGGYSIIGGINKSQQFTTDIIWKAGINKTSSIEIGALYRFFNNLYFEKQTLQFDSFMESFSSPVQISAGEKGQVGGGRIRFNYQFTPQLGQRFFYSFRTAISGDDIFQDVWESLARHKIGFTLNYHPVENFSMWAMLSYLSSSNWIEYQEAAGQSGGKYSSTVNEAMILDMAAQKWIWHKRIRGSLLFRNIFNQLQKYHPNGASLELRFHIQAEILLDSIWSPE
jgi:hypothetical protein